MNNIKFLPKFVNKVKSIAPQESVKQAMDVLKKAKSPLIIIGKGAAYA